MQESENVVLLTIQTVNVGNGDLRTVQTVNVDPADAEELAVADKGESDANCVPDRRSRSANR